LLANDVPPLAPRNPRLHNSFGATYDTDRAAHPTVKAIGPVADAVRDSSARGAIVFILLSAPASLSSLPSERVDEPAIGLDPLSVGRSIDRWQRITPKIVVSGSPAGQAFSGVQGNRSSTDGAVGDHQQRRG